MQVTSIFALFCISVVHAGYRLVDEGDYYDDHALEPQPWFTKNIDIFRISNTEYF